MSAALIHIVITVWVGSQPVRYELPELYPLTSTACQERAGKILAHRKKDVRMIVECVEAEYRDA
jgi:hypothetical protein